MSKFIEHYYVSWDEIQDRCVQMARHLKAEGRTFKRILAITRGGLFPAGIIARELGIHHVETICIKTYGGKGEQDVGEPELLKPADPEYLKDTLIIDDLVDTGTTLKYIKPMTENCYFLAVFAKPMGEPMLDLYHMTIEQEKWVMFPWDTRRQYVDPVSAA